MTWTSVDDDLPDSDTVVLAANVHDGSMYCAMLSFGIWVVPTTSYLTLGAVTHWMPLPELPDD